jgi:FkbM family methyltransferase
MCRKNIIDNNLSHIIKLNKVGLGSLNGKINKWNDEEVGLPGSSLVNLNGFPNDLAKKELTNLITENGKIEIRTIDSYKFSNIGFIKLDCEGMELDILEGAKECLIDNNFPPLFIEIWIQDGWRKDVEYYKEDYKNDIFNFLLNIGYHKGVKINHDDYIFLNENDYNRTL